MTRLERIRDAAELRARQVRARKGRAVQAEDYPSGLWVEIQPAGAELIQSPLLCGEDAVSTCSILSRSSHPRDAGMDPRHPCRLEVDDHGDG